MCNIPEEYDGLSLEQTEIGVGVVVAARAAAISMCIPSERVRPHIFADILSGRREYERVECDVLAERGDVDLIYGAL